MKVTLEAIARELQLSPATVSRSLRDNSAIHPETRRRVNQAAVRLGYVGTSGRARQSKPAPSQKAIGLLLSGRGLSDSHHEPNVIRVIEGIMAGADSQGLLLNIQAIPTEASHFLDENPSVVPSLIKGKVCQAAIMRGGHRARDVAYISSMVPVVSLGRRYRDLKLDSVLYDDIEGVRSMVSQLATLGHRRMAWVRTLPSNYFYEARQVGFVMGCLGNNLPIPDQQFLVTDSPINGLALLTPSILEAVREGVTSFVCANDNMAYGIIKILEAENLSVPDDISVTGFDALPSSMTGERQMTGVDPHFDEIGRAAVNMASFRIKNPTAPPQTLVVQGTVVPGETIGPVKMRS